MTVKCRVNNNISEKGLKTKIMENQQIIISLRIRTLLFKSVKFFNRALSMEDKNQANELFLDQ